MTTTGGQVLRHAGRASWATELLNPLALSAGGVGKLINHRLYELGHVAVMSPTACNIIRGIEETRPSSLKVRPRPIQPLSTHRTVHHSASPPSDLGCRHIVFGLAASGGCLWHRVVVVMCFIARRSSAQHPINMKHPALQKYNAM